jgi:hypothetical protein
MDNFKVYNDQLNLQKDIQGFSSSDAIDELEGIVCNEPTKNKYETVKFHKLNMFPYFLIGKVVSKFDFDGVNKYLNGVGMLIGPDIVLTVAHNLCHMIKTGNPSNPTRTLISKKVCFFAAANGDFNLFEPVKSVKTYIPPSYIQALKTENAEEQLYSDWGLIFLNSNIGDSITNLLDIENSNYLKKVGQFYSFFLNNENLNMLKISKQTKTEKISIVGYTEFKDQYRNNTAYKFANNFSNKVVNEGVSKKMSTTNCSPEKSKEAKGGKINFNGLNEIINQQEKDKKININININTNNPESVTEGFITSSRYFQKSNPDMVRNSVNGFDYIVLGNEEYNKDFDLNDADKQIMSESKGMLKGLDELPEEDLISQEHLRAIKYQISTYKGQSGSPIFMRVKRIAEKGPNSQNSKPQYIYQFIGLHSRRGPTEEKFYESEKMNALTENLMTGDVNPHIRNNNILMKNSKIPMEEGELSTEIKLKQCADNESINVNNEICKQNGICKYNMALSIMGNTIKEIKEIIRTQHSSQDDNDTNSNKSDFVLAKIHLNDQIKLSGLFKRNVPLSVLFTFGSKIFNVPKEYILLRDMTSVDIPSIQNYNFDQNKKLSEIIEDAENTLTISFELMLNIKKYGEFMSNNILQKFLENYDLEESQLKKDFEKKHMKTLFHSIFSEINSFDNILPTYGKLFKKIRKTILLKLGMSV